MLTARDQIFIIAPRGHVGLDEDEMRNPWTTKNPFMSAWLSTANKVMGSARGQAKAAVKREATNIQADATKQVLDFWSGKTSATRSSSKRKK